MPKRRIRHLVLVLGDQLNADSAALADFKPQLDRVLMIESVHEASQVWSHKARIAMFLSAMRHFATTLEAKGMAVDYVFLSDALKSSLAEVLAERLAILKPEKLVLVEPGEYRLKVEVASVGEISGTVTVMRADNHFFVSVDEFAQWAKGYKQLRMESFYRHIRKETRILMVNRQPEGETWNYDHTNRKTFGRAGPGQVRAPLRFLPDNLTREVLAVVESQFASHPGSLANFNWPVTREDALHALEDFITHRLVNFGEFQDAMWQGEPWLYHSTLSAALNLKLLNPRELIAAAINAYRLGLAPLAAIEGFVRQIIGWREFIRGIYWLDMPALKESNHFGNNRTLPAWYWTGETHMNCMRQAIGQTLDYGYAHHIQRLMVTGMFGVLAEIAPKALSDWYLAIYVDAVEWVELPNVIGMALFANGRRFATKPYVASGAYIQRMSNYCKGCRYDPKIRVGPNACPITTLYWRFLDIHEDEFANDPRTALMVKNLQRLSREERAEIVRYGDELLETVDSL
jgi:deoxyribodipyrimidine photolyase-related protein